MSSIWATVLPVFSDTLATMFIIVLNSALRRALDRDASLADINTIGDSSFAIGWSCAVRFFA
jgi:hypothetical protein